MLCSLCREGWHVVGDTGGTDDSLKAEEAVLVESLATCRRGNYGAAQLVLRGVNVQEFTPAQAFALAASSSNLYPSGVVVLHLGS